MGLFGKLFGGGGGGYRPGDIVEETTYNVNGPMRVKKVHRNGYIETEFDNHPGIVGAPMSDGTPIGQKGSCVYKPSQLRKR